MKKRPTDFSQISLLSNQKAKLIYLKNSKENHEHVKLCKSFELAKHGIRASHGKKKKDLEKRLERHNQDSLNVDDIKCLRKYVGDARDENEFCSQFIESGRTRRTRSSSVSSKKGHELTREMSKLDARSSFIGDLGKNMGFIPNEQSQLQTNFSKQNNTCEPTDVFQFEERESNSAGFVKSSQVGHNKHSRSCPVETTDAAIGKTRSPKVQREYIAKQNHSEMLSGSKPDMVSLGLKVNDTTESSKETVYARAGACENSDENNNCLEGKKGGDELKNFDSENQEKNVCNTESSAGVDQSSRKVSSELGNGNAFGKQIGEQRRELKKGPVILKRLGPTPNECEEDVDEEALQHENGRATERQVRYTKERTSSVIRAKENGNSTSNDPPVRRRRSSWAGPRTIPERLFKREFPESLPNLGRNFDSGNDGGRPVLDNFDRASQKSFETESTDGFDCASTISERRQGYENFDAIKRSSFLQKANSIPFGLGKPKMYSEEPFYMRPRRLSRRPSWQSIKLSEETLKGLEEIANKAKTENETMNNEPEPEPETPLVSILPPITLQSIYAQQCNKEKREQEQERLKQRGTQKKIGEEKSIDLGILSEKLKDCRYLRLKKDPNM